MCGIKFNTDALEHRCGHCGKLALEEAPEFKASVGLWLCSTCIELPDAVLRGQAVENKTARAGGGKQGRGLRLLHFSENTFYFLGITQHQVVFGNAQNLIVQNTILCKDRQYIAFDTVGKSLFFS